MMPKTPTPAPTSSAAVAVAAVFGGQWAAQRDPYADSPFLALKQRSSRSKGSDFERIAEWYLKENGYPVAKAESSAYDRLVDGRRVEIKGSFLWEGREKFRWQQIRLDQEYDYIIFMAFWPDRVEYYTCTKAVACEELRKRDGRGRLPHNQHGGSMVDSGTFFLDGLPSEYPWLLPLGVGFPAPIGHDKP